MNSEASKYLRDYLESSTMIKYPPWKPFNERYFEKVDEFEISENCDKEIKKWLYNRHIPFDKFVYVDCDRSGQSVALTWKMVSKYWEGLFFADDLTIFDETLNWALYYFHEDRLYFGSEKIYDKEFEYNKTIELNELKSRLFNKNTKIEESEKINEIKKIKDKYNINEIK